MTATLIDGVASVASIAVSGRVANSVSAKLGGGVWAEVAGGAAAGATFTIVQKSAEVGTYKITNGQAGKAFNLGETVTELAVSTVAGAGLAFVGSVMSGSLRGNYKVMWNSPNELNPTPFKLVEASISGKSNALRGSLADSTGGSILAHAGGTLSTPVGLTLAIPRAGSLTTAEAVTWLKAQGELIPKLIDKSASLREQAFQAAELQKSLTVAARNAMEDANAAAQLNIVDPPRNFEDLIRANKGKYAGDALYRKVIKDASGETDYRAVSLPGGCFVAGTLVHTKEGLIPIEKVAVGDWVLSQPEGKGAPSYKRVVRTFVYDDKEIFIVRYHKDGPGDDDMLIETLGVTGNHPFWVQGVGWTRADILKNGDRVELQDGSSARIICSVQLCRTGEGRTGWARGAWGIEANDGSGNRIELDKAPIAVEFDETFVDWSKLQGDEHETAFKCKRSIIGVLNRGV